MNIKNNKSEDMNKMLNKEIECPFEKKQMELDAQIENGEVQIFNPNDDDLDHDCCGA